MITYIKGDIFKGGDQVIVHGCNCLHTFGAGVALQVNRLYPGAFNADMETGYKDAGKLGTYSFWEGKNYYLPAQPITIVNAYTQFYPGANFDYNALERVLPFIRNRWGSVAMPKIGAGIAGGDWIRIEEMINSCFGKIEVKIYILYNNNNNLYNFYFIL
ncbi:MAG: macro domain-containing protein [Nitrospirae bacterium]|nr:macro domain-containing protein [Nitrospirota bacterium]